MAQISFIKDEENKIIERKIVGEINSQEVLDTFQTIVDMVEDGFEAIGIINDLTEGKLNVSLNEIPKIASFLKKNAHVFSKVRMAACVNSPSNITIPLLVARQAIKINIKAFSTVEAARQWILSHA